MQVAAGFSALVVGRSSAGRRPVGVRPRTSPQTHLAVVCVRLLGVALRDAGRTALHARGQGQGAEGPPARDAAGCVLQLFALPAQP